MLQVYFVNASTARRLFYRYEYLYLHVHIFKTFAICTKKPLIIQIYKVRVSITTINNDTIITYKI